MTERHTIGCNGEGVDSSSGAEKQGGVSPLISMTYMVKSGKGEAPLPPNSVHLPEVYVCGAPSSLSLSPPSLLPCLSLLARCPSWYKIWALYKWHLEDPLMPSIPQDYI